MPFYNDPIFYVSLGAFVAAGLGAYWTLISLRQEKNRLLKGDYHDHVKDLMKTVVDKTPTLSSERSKDDDFGKSVSDNQLKKNILQHFFSYQETDHVKIFDLYVHHVELGFGHTTFNPIFYRYFSEMETKSKSEFGACDDCIAKFGFREKKKYKKILNSFPKDTGILN